MSDGEVCKRCGRTQRIAWSLRDEVWAQVPEEWQTKTLCLECVYEVGPQPKLADFVYLQLPPYEEAPLVEGGHVTAPERRGSWALSEVMDDIDWACIALVGVMSQMRLAMIGEREPDWEADVRELEVVLKELGRIRGDIDKIYEYMYRKGGLWTRCLPDDMEELSEEE